MSSAERWITSLIDKNVATLSSVIQRMDAVEHDLEIIVRIQLDDGSEGKKRLTDAVDRIETQLLEFPSIMSKADRVGFLEFQMRWINGKIFYPLEEKEQAMLRELRDSVVRRRTWAHVRKVVVFVPLVTLACVAMLVIVAHFALSGYETALRIRTSPSDGVNATDAARPADALTARECAAACVEGLLSQPQVEK